MNQNEMLDLLKAIPGGRCGWEQALETIGGLKWPESWQARQRHAVDFDASNRAPVATWARIIRAENLGLDALTVYRDSKASPTPPTPAHIPGVSPAIRRALDALKEQKTND